MLRISIVLIISIVPELAFVLVLSCYSWRRVFCLVFLLDPVLLLWLILVLVVLVFVVSLVPVLLFVVGILLVSVLVFGASVLVLFSELSFLLILLLFLDDCLHQRGYFHLLYIYKVKNNYSSVFEEAPLTPLSW